MQALSASKGISSLFFQNQYTLDELIILSLLPHMESEAGHTRIATCVLTQD